MQNSVVLWDLMPRRLSRSNTATLENMWLVKHIKHVHLQSNVFFLFVYMVFERRNQKLAKDRLCSSGISFFFPLFSSCRQQLHLCHLASSPHHALESTSAISAQGLHLLGVRDDAQVWIPKVVTLCAGYSLITAPGENTSSTNSAGKVLKQG